MKNYKITSQKCNIGWKETDYVGSVTTQYFQAESLFDLFDNEEVGLADESFAKDDPQRYSKMIEAVEADGGFMTNEYDGFYWEDPEPCDSYLTYGIWHDITEISDEQLEKYKTRKKLEEDKKLQKNKDKWDKIYQTALTKDIRIPMDLRTFLKDNYNAPSERKK